MVKNKSRVLLIIDVLTLSFLIIQIQSIIACKMRVSESSYTYGKSILDILQLYKYYGWSEILNDYLGQIVPWSKTLLFFANIYAVILKLIGIIRRTIPTKRFAFIVINLLFIVLKLIEFDSFLTALMSV